MTRRAKAVTVTTMITNMIISMITSTDALQIVVEGKRIPFRNLGPFVS